jgi:hypothetical protein
MCLKRLEIPTRPSFGGHQRLYSMATGSPVTQKKAGWGGFLAQPFLCRKGGLLCRR